MRMAWWRVRVLGLLASSGCCMGAPSLPAASSTPPGVPAMPGAPSQPAPPPSSPDAPIGSPGFCAGDDGTGVPLATSSFRSTLDLAAARAELDSRNEICGDTWCEGSFEWFAYDLRADAARSELTFRTYSYQTEPVASVADVVVHGGLWTGRVLSQHVVPACTSPCRGFAEPPRWAPCLVLDVRCEIAAPAPTDPFGGDMAWENELIACGGALEQAIRARVPEQFPEP